MGQPIPSFSLQASTPVLYVGGMPQTTDQLAQQAKSTSAVSQENTNDVMHVNWIPQDPSRRTTQRLLGNLNDRSAMLESSIRTSQRIQSQLDQTTSQYRTSFNQFESQETAYRGAREQEQQRNDAFTSRMERSGFTPAVYRVPEEGSIQAEAAGKVYVTVGRNATSSTEHHLVATPIFSLVGSSPFFNTPPLPPPEPIEKVNEKTQQELKTATQEYFGGYLVNSLKKVEEPLGSIVFRDVPDLPIANGTGQAFVFAGEFLDMHDEKAIAAFPDRNYVRCQNQLLVRDSDAPNRHRQVDVIITGTTDQKKCGEFAEQFLNDAAQLAARNTLAPNHPYSDTQVVSYAHGKFKKEGDLITAMPQATQEEILAGNFKACPAPTGAFEKTRLSNEEYKDVGVIVRGMTSPNTCEALHMTTQSARVEDYKKAKIEASLYKQALADIEKLKKVLEEQAKTQTK